MFFPIPKILPLLPAVCTALLVSCVPLAGPEKSMHGLRVYFLDVGQGDACVLRTPENGWYLFDVGKEPRLLIGFLERAGADTLRAVILSHPDYDHFGSLKSLLAAFPVKKVYLPEGESPDPAWRETLRALDASPAAKETLYAGDSVPLDAVRARALWPPPRALLEGNDLSTVMRVEYAGKRILLTGDIEAAAENALLAARTALSADILKVAHHGSRSSSGLGFLEAVRPKWAVISCDSSVYGHPHPEAISDLMWVMRDSARILRTDREGTLAFELDERGIRRIDER